MRRESLKFLYDMQTACEQAARFVEGRTVEDYLQDAMLRSAVERQMVIVGEALSQALRQDPDLEQHITDARRIVAFRNVVVHEYMTLDHATVWGVVQGHLPGLHREVTAILSDNPPDG